MFAAALKPRVPKFPEIKTFQEIFLEYRPRRDLNPATARQREIRLDQKKSWFNPRETPCYLQGYLSMTLLGSGYEYLDVLQVAPFVLEFFQEHVLGVSADRVYFTVIEHKDGTASVGLQHNQIIGSHFLAEIDAKTIPRFGKDES